MQHNKEEETQASTLMRIIMYTIIKTPLLLQQHVLFSFPMPKKEPFFIIDHFRLLSSRRHSSFLFVLFSTITDHHSCFQPFGFP